MTLLPLLCLIAGVLLVLVLLGGSLGRFIGRCSGWPVAGFEAYPMAGLRHPRLTPWLGSRLTPWLVAGRWAQGQGAGRSRLYTLLLSRAYPLQGGGCDHTLWGGGDAHHGGKRKGEAFRLRLSSHAYAREASQSLRTLKT